MNYMIYLVVKIYPFRTFVNSIFYSFCKYKKEAEDPPFQENSQSL